MAKKVKDELPATPHLCCIAVSKAEDSVLRVLTVANSSAFPNPRQCAISLQELPDRC
jgi:hypothetical protein